MVEPEFRKLLLGALVSGLLLGSASAADAKLSPADVAGIASFNEAFTEATRRMDNEATLSLWEEDGIALLPGTAPMRGKSAIRSALQAITTAHPNARMESFTNKCSDIEGSGNWASEWCFEHQVVTEPGKPTFDGKGKMLLVLHKQPSGEWRLSREMWNQAGPSEGQKGGA